MSNRVNLVEDHENVEQKGDMKRKERGGDEKGHAAGGKSIDLESKEACVTEEGRGGCSVQPCADHKGKYTGEGDWERNSEQFMSGGGAAMAESDGSSGHDDGYSNSREDREEVWCDVESDSEGHSSRCGRGGDSSYLNATGGITSHSYSSSYTQGNSSNTSTAPLPSSPSHLSALSTKDLIGTARALNVRLEGCVEKSDLIAAISQHPEFSLQR